MDQGSLPTSHQLCLLQECKQIPTGLSHCRAYTQGGELCKEPWRLLGKNSSEGEEGQPQEFAPVTVLQPMRGDEGEDFVT